MPNHSILKHSLPFLLMGSAIAFALYFWFTRRVLSYAALLFLNDE